MRNLLLTATVMLFSSPTSTRRRMAVWEVREHHGEILRQATRLVEAGKIMHELDHRHFTLVRVCDAYWAIKTGLVPGKIVMDVDLLVLSPASETAQQEQEMRASVIRRRCPWEGGGQPLSGAYPAVSSSVRFAFHGGDKVRGEKVHEYSELGREMPARRP